ncbi:UNKNOWN [Stylonychia lemnae]|uniref:Uncharacterized protein n=1 Tax=Stylonychia lemnae TaxID=5949 RepID=A0A078AM55_STYLE|nr:UNKNOWN [Stylonychia lemnae]|eukprot:CDW82966.1 UNKNOWN [Stylonychia lemnae]
MVLPVTSDLLGTNRSNEKKLQELRKWKNLQEEVNEVYHQTNERIGLYLEFLDFILINKGRLEQQPVDQKVQFKQSDKDNTLKELEPSEKYKVLKDVFTKVNDKVQILELKAQGNLGIDSNVSEGYYDQKNALFKQVKDVGDLTEKDLLKEIESKIDLNREEDLIEDFVKEKQKIGKSADVFSIYKLKSKVMNEKIDKIKRQFSEQTSTVINIRRSIDDNLLRIESQMKELQEVGSLNNNERASLVEDIKQETEQPQDPMTQQLIEQVQEKQRKLESQIDAIISEIQQIIFNSNQSQSLDSLRNKLGEIENQISDLKDSKKQVEAQNQELTERQTLINQQNEEFKSQIEQYKQKSENNELEGQEKDKRIFELSEENLTLQLELDQIRQQLLQSEDKNKQYENEINKLKEEQKQTVETKRKDQSADESDKEKKQEEEEEGKKKKQRKSKKNKKNKKQQEQSEQENQEQQNN